MASIGEINSESETETLVAINKRSEMIYERINANQVNLLGLNFHGFKWMNSCEGISPKNSLPK